MYPVKMLWRRNLIFFCKSSLRTTSWDAAVAASFFDGLNYTSGEKLPSDGKTETMVWNSGKGAGCMHRLWAAQQSSADRIVPTQSQASPTLHPHDGEAACNTCSSTLLGSQLPRICAESLLVVHDVREVLVLRPEP